MPFSYGWNKTPGLSIICFFFRFLIIRPWIVMRSPWRGPSRSWSPGFPVYFSPVNSATKSGAPDPAIFTGPPRGPRGAVAPVALFFAGVRKSSPRSCTKESVSQVCEGVRCVGVRRSPLRRCAKESASQVYEGVRFARRDALPSASACTQK